MRLLTIFIFLIFSSFAGEAADIKNLIINKELKKYDSLTFLDDKSNKLNLSDYRGNLIILNFWATWCAPCKEEMPHLDKLKSKSKFQDIEILPINIADEELAKSETFFKELNINNLEIFYGSSLGLAKVFKLRGIPTTILIDKEGYEFARIIGFIDFENEPFLDWLYKNL